MQRKVEISIWQLLISVIMLYTIMPIVSRAISTYLTTYFYLAVVVVVVVYIVLANKGKSFNEYVGGLLLPFLLYQALTFLLRTDSVVMWGYKVLLFILPVVIGYYIMQYKQHHVTFYSRLICVALVITMITTCIGLVLFPSASRVLATVDSTDEAAILYNWYNIGGFDFIYMIVLLYPILIMAYKQRKIHLPTALCGTALVYATVLLSEYTTALLLLLLSTVLFFVKRDLTKRDIFLLLVIGVVLLLVCQSVLPQLLAYIGTLTGSETVSERLAALAGGTAGLEASEDNRIFLYRRSLTTFLQHPLFGTFLSGGGGVGGHSGILDILGKYGLLGAGLLCWMYRKIYRYFVAPYKDMPGYGFILWTLLQAIVLSVLNPGLWLSVLALIVPIFVSHIYGGHIYGDGDTSDEDSLDCEYAAGVDQ